MKAVYFSDHRRGQQRHESIQRAETKIYKSQTASKSLEHL